jgi:hypothetical protein
MRIVFHYMVGDGKKSVGKEVIRRRLTVDGFDPESFVFYFLNEENPEGELDSCSFENLPENLDSFCCEGRDGRPLYNYDRRNIPNIERVK